VIAISDAAKKELKRILTENTEDPAVVLRLTATPEGELGLIMDSEEVGDNVIEHDGNKVLVIEAELANALKGVNMDVEETEEGPMLTFRGSCGCDSCHDEHSSCGDSCGHEGRCGGS
jgi:Fe-S cluster assembly iron-binding protein IscA